MPEPAGGHVIERDLDDDFRLNWEPLRILGTSPAARTAGRGTGKSRLLHDRFEQFGGARALLRAHRADEADVVQQTVVIETE